MSVWPLGKIWSKQSDLNAFLWRLTCSSTLTYSSPPLNASILLGYETNVGSNNDRMWTRWLFVSAKLCSVDGPKLPSGTVTSPHSCSYKIYNSGSQTSVAVSIDHFIQGFNWTKKALIRDQKQYCANFCPITTLSLNISFDLHRHHLFHFFFFGAVNGS